MSVLDENGVQSRCMKIKQEHDCEGANLNFTLARECVLQHGCGRTEALPPLCPTYVNSTPRNTARKELHSMITFHHANTRGSSSRIAHLCVVEQLSSTCHVSSFASPDTDHKHKFSLVYLTCLSDDLSNTQYLRYTIFIYFAIIHGRVADQHKIPSLTGYERPNSSRPKRSNLKTSSRRKVSLRGILGWIHIKCRKVL